MHLSRERELLLNAPAAVQSIAIFGGLLHNNEHFNWTLQPARVCS